MRGRIAAREPLRGAGLHAHAAGRCIRLRPARDVSSRRPPPRAGRTRVSPPQPRDGRPGQEAARPGGSERTSGHQRSGRYGPGLRAGARAGRSDAWRTASCGGGGERVAKDGRYSNLDFLFKENLWGKPASSPVLRATRFRLVTHVRLSKHSLIVLRRASCFYCVLHHFPLRPAERTASGLSGAQRLCSWTPGQRDAA